MKRIILATAILLSGFSAIAQSIQSTGNLKERPQQIPKSSSINSTSMNPSFVPKDEKSQQSKDQQNAVKTSQPANAVNDKKKSIKK
jgi:hypothetical protein